MPNTVRRPDDDRRRREAQRRRQREEAERRYASAGTTGSAPHRWSVSLSWDPWTFPSCF